MSGLKGETRGVLGGYVVLGVLARPATRPLSRIAHEVDEPALCWSYDVSELPRTVSPGDGRADAATEASDRRG